ncbi:WXG100 family type VII secretion target [Streptomyces sp. NPDC051207]|uniref:WXG100 family type VII secretion target n=1 Tax=Streptomyces sp. NPDC051207 TaxID=3154641 RepID=UPI0034291CD8
MATGREFDDSHAQKLKTEIIDRYDGIRGTLAQLQGTIDMIEKAWQGEGANAFNAKQTEINSHMVEIGKMLQDFLEGVQLNTRDKNALEDQIRADMAGISVDLGGKTSALNSY